MASIKAKDYQVDITNLRKKLKLCTKYMEQVNNGIGNLNDGEENNKTLIGSVERLNSKCWSDGQVAKKWYDDNQNDLDEITKRMKNINENLKNLDIIETFF